MHTKQLRFTSILYAHAKNYCKYAYIYTINPASRPSYTYTYSYNSAYHNTSSNTSTQKPA